MEKKYRITLFSLFFMLMMSLSGAAQNDVPQTTNQQTQPQAVQTTGQQKVIKGQVFEKSTGEPMPGVVIRVVKSTRGVSTDLDGSFEIKASPSESLEFSYLGMKTQVIKVGAQNVLNVKMVEQGNELDEVQVVAFGKQKKESVVGSITTVRAEDLRAPSSNLTTSLAGNIAGVIAYQRSGEPGADDADFFVRGITTFGANTSPLILIDNIELTSTDLANLRPDDIESFSILKDASATALYGARGANGVILVTTKRGQEGPLKVFARLETNISAPTETVDLADPVTYMKSYNEAISTRDPTGELMYSYDKIEQTGKPNANRYIYPANDWYKMCFKNNTQNYRADVSLRGGGKIATYYVSGAYSQDTGVLKVDHRNSFNNNIDNKKYTIRTNVDINLTKTTKFKVNLTGNFQDYTGPVSSGSDMYKYVMHSDPVLFAPYYPLDDDHVGIKHIMFGNYDDGSYINPYEKLVSGYKDYNRSQILVALRLDQNLDFITKGLTFSTLFNLTRLSSWTVTREYSPYWYALDSYDSYTGEYHVTRLNETGTDYLNYNEGTKVLENTMYSESRLNYQNTFGKHSLGGLLVFTIREEKEANAGSLQLSLPSRNVSLAGRFTYGFDDRYFMEFNFGYNGSERFSKQHRWGFFPSFGGAWMVSNEKWFEPLKKIFSKFKLRYTYGWVGNDNIGTSSNRFYYLSQINMNNSSTQANFGETGSISGNTITVSRYANDAITWEKAQKQNYAWEFTLFKDIDVIAEYYTEHRSNIFMQRADIPSTMGLQSSIYANIGEAKAHGVDIQLDYRKSWTKHFWSAVRGNFTFARSKYTVYEEPEYAEPWRSHVGHSIKQQWGYIAERLFVDDEDAANSPSQAAFGSEYGGGDIKYTDVNNDGIINESDRVPIGNPTSPEIIYGFGVSIGYKGFDVSTFFQGLANESFWIDAASMAPFKGRTQLMQAIVDSHWSEDNRDIYAFWPRYSAYLNYNNTCVSTWWMRNGSFLRMKQFELGYTLPTKLTQRLHIANLRFYVSGTNLFCLSSFDIWDPEQGDSGLNYPVQRTFNIGLNITLK